MADENRLGSGSGSGQVAAPRRSGFGRSVSRGAMRGSRAGGAAGGGGLGREAMSAARNFYTKRSPLGFSEFSQVAPGDPSRNPGVATRVAATPFVPAPASTRPPPPDPVPAPVTAALPPVRSAAPPPVTAPAVQQGATQALSDFRQGPRPVPPPIPLDPGPAVAPAQSSTAESASAASAAPQGSMQAQNTVNLDPLKRLESLRPPMISDERAKKDIKPVPKASVDGFLRSAGKRKGY